MVAVDVRHQLQREMYPRHLHAASLAALIITPHILGWSPLPGSQSGGGVGNDGIVAPPPRFGHSAVVWNGSFFVFGGRGADSEAMNDPLTYALQDINGSLSIASYNSQHVLPCAEGASMEACYNVPVATLMNDIWALPLSSTTGTGGSSCSTTAATDACRATAAGTWTLVVPGAVNGGCVTVNGEDACSHPPERWGHGSAAFDDGTFVVYGGASPLCTDYCDDTWLISLAACVTASRGSGGSSGSVNSQTCAWTRRGDLSGAAGPGKRWSFAHAVVPRVGWFIFGGQRLWHGFAPSNSAENRWNDTEGTSPRAGPGAPVFGGFLDDLWTLGFDVAGGVSAWAQVTPRESCYSHPGASWARRNEVICTVHWPARRSGAALAAVTTGARSSGSSSATAAAAASFLYLFGGYGVPYPYPNTQASGAGPGTAQLAADGPAPYPTAPYYLGDLWRYDIAAALWERMAPLPDAAAAAAAASGSINGVPSPRRGHVLASLPPSPLLLLLFGGYTSGAGAGGRGGGLLGDTWVLTLPANGSSVGSRWRYSPGTTPLLPPNCTSDVEPAAGGAWSGNRTLNESTLSAVAATAALAAANNAVYPGGGDALASLGLLATSASVAGEPTRGTAVDGRAGRSSTAVRVPQPRRRAPSWDGCRDRADGRTDLPAVLQYVSPEQRRDAAAAFDAAGGSLYVFGGLALPREEPPSAALSYAAAAVSDTWVWAPSGCGMSACSGHGACASGVCVCAAGWWGSDCSNATCPGSVCWVDEVATGATTCVHCCSAGWRHSDDVAPASSGAGDVAVLGYVAGVSKAACAAPSTPYGAPSGESHGICDGFGTCQCAPPFIGPDCSVRDCPNACSGRGRCAVEWPMARCECVAPYSGVDCSLIACARNCTWPNGACNTKSGVCACSFGWAGADCSGSVDGGGGRDATATAGAGSLPSASSRAWVAAALLLVLAAMPLPAL